MDITDVKNKMNIDVFNRILLKYISTKNLTKYVLDGELGDLPLKIWYERYIPEIKNPTSFDEYLLDYNESNVENFILNYFPKLTYGSEKYLLNNDVYIKKKTESIHQLEEAFLEEYSTKSEIKTTIEYFYKSKILIIDNEAPDFDRFNLNDVNNNFYSYYYINYLSEWLEKYFYILEDIEIINFLYFDNYNISFNFMDEKIRPKSLKALSIGSNFIKKFKNISLKGIIILEIQCTMEDIDFKQLCEIVLNNKIKVLYLTYYPKDTYFSNLNIFSIDAKNNRSDYYNDLNIIGKVGDFNENEFNKLNISLNILEKYLNEKGVFVNIII